MMALTRNTSLLVSLLLAQASAFAPIPACSRIQTTTRTTQSLWATKDEKEDGGDDSIMDDAELSQFEKDLLEAFGKEDEGEAFDEAALSAFSVDLRQIEDWDDAEAELVSPDEAFELYQETMSDMESKKTEKKNVDLSKYEVDVPEDERQYVEDMIAKTNKVIEDIWGPSGLGGADEEKKD